MVKNGNLVIEVLTNMLINLWPNPSKKVGKMAKKVGKKVGRHFKNINKYVNGQNKSGQKIKSGQAVSLGAADFAGFCGQIF